MHYYLCLIPKSGGNLSCMLPVLLLTTLTLLAYLLGSLCLRGRGGSGVRARLCKLFLCSSAKNPSPTMQSKFSEIVFPLTSLGFISLNSFFIDCFFLFICLSLMHSLYHYFSLVTMVVLYYIVWIQILSYRQLLCSLPALYFSPQ